MSWIAGDTVLAFSLIARVGVLAMDSMAHTALPFAFAYCGKLPPCDVPAAMPRRHSVDRICSRPN